MYDSRVCFAHLAVDCGIMYSFVNARYSFTGAAPVSDEAIFPSYNAYSLGSVKEMNSVSLLKLGNLPAKLLNNSATARMLGIESCSFFLVNINSFIDGILENPPGINL